MRRRTPIIVLLTLVIVWPVLAAAHALPLTPPASPTRLILGVERISDTAWALLVGCPSHPHDIQVWAEETAPQRPQTITALAPERWRAHFTGALPQSATIYGCGQSAALVIATTTPPLWLHGLFSIGATTAILLGARFIRRAHRTISPLPKPPSTAVWQAQLTDEEGERTITLPTGLLTAGSDPACHVIVLAPDIALRHAHLIITEEYVQIVDLASPSGVFCGPVRRRLRPHTPTLVSDEDIWLGATARLRLVKIGSRISR